MSAEARNAANVLDAPRFALGELRELRKALAGASHYVGPVGISGHATETWRNAKHWLDRVDSLIAETEEGGFDV